MSDESLLAWASDILKVDKQNGVRSSRADLFDSSVTLNSRLFTPAAKRSFSPDAADLQSNRHPSHAASALCFQSPNDSSAGGQYLDSSKKVLSLGELRDASLVQALLASTERSGSESLDCVVRLLRGRVFSVASNGADAKWLATLLPCMSTIQLNMIIEEVHRRLPAMALHDVGHAFCLCVINALKSPYQMRLVGQAIGNKIHALLAQPRGHVVLSACLHRFTHTQASPLINEILNAAQFLQNSSTGAALLSSATFYAFNGIAVHRPN
eukprot:TRINITY_DN8125_c0_g1_i2.p1 TRINITY_DN8125_c0_g1~~TRINITY_DN8125_c0_g1_i2.p1  ORF type:complete len:286 (-),score=40.07 TRINITY_DN8125_c0_g1_i2:98-901(-)